MILRLAAVAAVALLLLATVGSAQTAAELLQKGIYAQQTAGNADGAIEIYRQVIGMAGADRAMAARAQMQLVSAFLQKGDMAGASREFNTLAMTYGDQKDVVSAMTMAMRAAASIRTSSAQGPRTPPEPRLGTLKDGVYHHNATGIEIRIPSGWSFAGDGPSSGGGEALNLEDASGQSYFVWLIPSAVPQSEISTAVDGDVEYKIHQRTVDGNGAFKMRPGSLIKRPWRDLMGVSVAFDMGPDGSQVEYDTFIRSTKTQVYIRSICPASRIASVQDNQQILASGLIFP